MIDSRETEKKAFVIGSPIRHSRSPLIHSYWLKQFGLNGSYQAIDVPEAELETFFSDLRSKGDYRGGNVTLPHKERAYHLADEPDELSREIGAANTIWVEEGRIKATNTDSYGFAANLDARAPGWDKIGSVVILGAGGASRAVIQAVRNRGIGEIHVVNRTLPRAQDLARHFGSPLLAHSFAALPELLRGSRLLINTTSLGMHGETAVDIDLSVMAPQAIVTDIVYVPLETPLLAEARRQGLRTVDGLGMLLHQAVPGFETWFGQRPVVDDNLRNLVIADMGKTA